MTENEIKAQNVIIKEVENAIKLLENHCQQFCDFNGVSQVPMNYIKTSVRLLLEGYHKGVEQARSQSEPTSPDLQEEKDPTQ